MAKHYHPFPRRAGSALKWGLLALLAALVVTFWPSQRRRIERQIAGMAETVTHHGAAVSRDWLEGLDKSVRENCSATTTTFNIEGLANEALSQEQIVQGAVQTVSDTTDFSVTLEHITVDLSDNSNRAQVNADAIVATSHATRSDRERRHITIALQRVDGKFRINSVEASANIVNQPEPRP